MKELHRFRQFLNEETKIEDTVANKLTPAVEKLTPEQIDQLKKELAALGVTPNSSVKDVANNIELSVNENEKSTTKEKVADALSSVGSGLMKSLLVPIIPVAIGSTGIGFTGGFAITMLTAGALIGLARALDKKEGSTEFGNN